MDMQFYSHTKLLAKAGENTAKYHFMNINDVYLYYSTYKLKRCFNNTLSLVIRREDAILFTQLPVII